MNISGKASFVAFMGAMFFMLAGAPAFAGRHPDASVKSGEVLFRHSCAGCHNKQPGDTSPFGPPNLHGIFQNKMVTAAEARDIIRHGKGSMPPFGALSDSQIAHLLAYLKTL